MGEEFSPEIHQPHPEVADDHLTNEQSNVVLTASSLETRCALLGLYRRSHETKTMIDIRKNVLGIQDGQPLWIPDRHYYLNLCDDLATSDMDILSATAADKQTGQHRAYTITDIGYYIARPAAGQLLTWGYQHNLPLRSILGEPRRNTDGSFSIRNRLAILGFSLLESRFTTKDLTAYFGGAVSYEVAYEHSKKLAELGVLAVRAINPTQSRSEKVYRLDNQYREAIQDLLTLHYKMINLDPDFYVAGHAMLDRLLDDSTAMRLLIKRVEYTSNAAGDKRTDIQGASRYAREFVKSVGGTVASATLLTRFGRDFTGHQRKSFLRQIRQDASIAYVNNGQGDYLFWVNEPTDKAAPQSEPHIS